MCKANLCSSKIPKFYGPIFTKVIAKNNIKQTHTDKFKTCGLRKFLEQDHHEIVIFPTTTTTTKKSSKSDHS